MKDFERIDVLEKEIKFIHQKFSILLERMDNQSEISDGILSVAKSTLAQNERLIKNIERLVAGK